MSEFMTGEGCIDLECQNFQSGEDLIDFKSIKWEGVRIFKSKRKTFLYDILYIGEGVHHHL